ncbi:hypothetical protein TDSAC_1675 [Thermodesulfobium acidiphilum]|uniref:Uncharacterized protein n=1 Tax=Thermodesulfobium acidiphilum TaxID=1794699 RepID=A0A2R4W2F6_THEAF|nr:hypothetical protein TDSAC_1675 [Thermodesulfobium acidiphilum]
MKKGKAIFNIILLILFFLGTSISIFVIVGGRRF